MHCEFFGSRKGAMFTRRFKKKRESTFLFLCGVYVLCIQYTIVKKHSWLLIQKTAGITHSTGIKISTACKLCHRHEINFQSWRTLSLSFSLSLGSSHANFF